MLGKITVDTLTQDWIDNFGWLGTLLILKEGLSKKSKNYQLIEEAIATIELEMSGAEAISQFNFNELLKSMLLNSESPQNHCPPKLKRFLEIAIKT